MVVHFSFLFSFFFQSYQPLQMKIKYREADAVLVLCRFQQFSVSFIQGEHLHMRFCYMYFCLRLTHGNITSVHLKALTAFSHRLCRSSAMCGERIIFFFDFKYSKKSSVDLTLEPMSPDRANLPQLSKGYGVRLNRQGQLTLARQMVLKHVSSIAACC